MTGKTHAICGTVACACVAVANAKGIEFGSYTLIPWVSILAAPAGSYLPDIDLPQSHMGHKHKIISKMLTHRGFTHTLAIPLILAALQWWFMSLPLVLVPELLFGFNIGWCAHILADMFNKKGVPILWPLTKKHFHVASVLTRSWQETVFIPFWIAACLALTFYTIH